MIKKPIIDIDLYDIPSEPSKLKVRVWREFQKLSPIYPKCLYAFFLIDDEIL